MQLQQQGELQLQQQGELQDTAELKSNLLEEMQALQQQHGELTRKYHKMHVFVRDLASEVGKLQSAIREMSWIVFQGRPSPYLGDINLAEEGARAVCDCEGCANGYDGVGQPAEFRYGTTGRNWRLDT